MASSKEYLTYILDLLREIRGISFKKMMGEYILYKDDVIFGGIYDNRFLVKKTKSIMDEGLSEQIPYPGGKAMFLIDSENSEEVKDIVLRVYRDLENK